MLVVDWVLVLALGCHGSAVAQPACCASMMWVISWRLVAVLRDAFRKQRSHMCAGLMERLVQQQMMSYDGLMVRMRFIISSTRIQTCIHARR